MRINMRTVWLALLILMISVTVALSHSWYDQMCCSGRDCAPAFDIKHNDDGSMVLTVRLVSRGYIPDISKLPSEDQEKWMVNYTMHVPADFPKKPSKDERIHACVNVFEDTPKLICVYVPAGS